MDDKNKIEIVPSDCYSQSSYARKINRSPTWVATLIKKGILECIQINGSFFVREIAVKIEDKSS